MPYHKLLIYIHSKLGLNRIPFTEANSLKTQPYIKTFSSRASICAAFSSFKIFSTTSPLGGAPGLMREQVHRPFAYAIICMSPVIAETGSDRWNNIEIVLTP